MASVRMTRDLRGGILAKFREALIAAEQKTPEIANIGDKMYRLVHSDDELEWLDLTSKLLSSMDPNKQLRINRFKNNINLSDKLVLLLAPSEKLNILKEGTNNTPRNNYDVIADWSSKPNKYSGAVNHKPEEVAIELPLGIKRPLIVNQRFYYSSYDNETSCTNAYIVTDSEIIDILSSFLDGELKTQEAVNKLDLFLETCTTLKKFLDEWPGAENLVPQTYIEKMFEKKVKNSVNPLGTINKNTLEQDFKEQMNAAILTAKLIN